MVESTVSSSSVEFTACETSPSARNSPDRAGKLIGALAQLGQQARVFNGDDGLAGEARDQLDLLVGKGTDFLAGHSERTDQFVLL